MLKSSSGTSLIEMNIAILLCGVGTAAALNLSYHSIRAANAAARPENASRLTSSSTGSQLAAGQCRRLPGVHEEEFFECGEEDGAILITEGMNERS
jgi:hypothetical protein